MSWFLGGRGFPFVPGKANWWERSNEYDQAYIDAFNKNFQTQKNNYPSAWQQAWTRIVNLLTRSNNYGIGENSNTIHGRSASDVGIIISEVEGAVNQNQ